MWKYLRSLFHYLVNEREGKRTWKRVGKSIITALFVKLTISSCLTLAQNTLCWTGALMKKNLLQIKILSAAFENENLENTYKVEPPSLPFYCFENESHFKCLFPCVIQRRPPKAIAF